MPASNPCPRGVPSRKQGETAGPGQPARAASALAENHAIRMTVAERANLRSPRRASLHRDGATAVPVGRCSLPEGPLSHRRSRTRSRWVPDAQADKTETLGWLRTRRPPAARRPAGLVNAWTRRTWLERLLIWRVWERMLEIEFVDRSVALAGKAFVSFFPLVIVIAAFVPERIRASIITALTARLGLQGDSLVLVRDGFASSDDIRKATGLLGLVLTVFFATSFTAACSACISGVAAALPFRGRCVRTWGGLAAGDADHAGDPRRPARRVDEGPLSGLLVIVALGVNSGLWWFTAWFFLQGEVRLRVLVPTGVVTGIGLTGYALSAHVWMPSVVTSNEAQFGAFGLALALVTWFSGAAICILIGAHRAGVRGGHRLRGQVHPGRHARNADPGAPPSLSPPVRERSLRDAFQSTEDS